MIKVLHKALNILEVVAETESGMTLSEIAAAIDERTTTASNIVQVLYKRNYLEKLQGKAGYRLGSAALMFADCRNGQYGSTLTNAATGILTSLSRDTESRSVLTIWRGGDRHVLVRVEDESPVTANINQGQTSLYHNATGVMLLACRDETTIRSYAERVGLPATSCLRTSSVEDLLNRLAWIREAGVFARDRGEIFEAAAAVNLGGGTTDAAIGIYLPSFRAGDRTKLQQRLEQAARELEEKYALELQVHQV